MNEVAALLARLAAQGLCLELRGGHIAATPKHRLTSDLRDEILYHRADVLELLQIHGSGLLRLFRDPPPWPEAQGRSGPVPANMWAAIGQAVDLRDGRSGALRLLEYDTRSGRMRCCVNFQNGWALVDPEDVRLLPVGRKTA